jgi:GTP-binding protein Era
MTPKQDFHCGMVAIVGRPNVGKSTLLNHLVGQKLSITTRRPQTTRHRIFGINTLEQAQVIYIDTPGIHHGGKRAMNRYLNRTAGTSLADADVVLFVAEGTLWRDEDDLVMKKLSTLDAPVILVLNKIDLVTDKADLLPHIEGLAANGVFADIVPLSAFDRKQVTKLEQMIVPLLPIGPPMFPEDQVTDRSERFLVAEIVREKLTRQLSQELPYAISCEVEEFKHEPPGLTRIGITIWVERPGQKAIVIGHKGAALKRVGQQARIDIEKMLGHKVFLQLWVRVKEGWSDDLRAMHSLGYD